MSSVVAHIALKNIELVVAPVPLAFLSVFTRVLEIAVLVVGAIHTRSSATFNDDLGWTLVCCHERDKRIVVRALVFVLRVVHAAHIRVRVGMVIQVKAVISIAGADNIASDVLVMRMVQRLSLRLLR